jgi:DNA-directed RNA polymerase specialized sigma24 family protein
MAQRLKRNPGFRRTDIEDLEQGLSMGLIEREPQFDAARGAPVAFALTVLPRIAATMVRDATRLKRDSRSVVALGKRAVSEFPAEERRRGISGSPIAARERVEALLAQVGDEDEEAVRLLAHVKQTQAARSLGIPRGQLIKKVKRLRLAARDAI